MKRILKVVSGFVAVTALACLLAVPAQARTFVSVNVGGGYGGGYGYGCAPRYVASPCAPAPVYVAAPAPCYAPAPAPCYVAATAPCYPVGYAYRAPVACRPAVSVGCFFPRFHFSGCWR